MLTLDKEHTNRHSVVGVTRQDATFQTPELTPIGLTLPGGIFVGAYGKERLMQYAMFHLLERKLKIFDELSKICNGNDILALRILRSAEKPVDRVGDFMRSDIVNSEFAYPFVKRGIFEHFNKLRVKQNP